MRYALSTCWAPVMTGEELVEKACSMGFDALELGYVTSNEQLAGIKAHRTEIAIDSVHAYCPCPIGAPSGHPELYQLCSDNPDECALAKVCLKRSFACAAEFGAKRIVFHAAYVYAQSFWAHLIKGFSRVETPTPALRKRRRTRGLKTLDHFKTAFETLIPDLEKNGLVLALENLPRFEGFPNVEEAEKLMRDMQGAPLALWFDTGHARIRECLTWDVTLSETAKRLAPWTVGMHLNDVQDVHDDHFAPSYGKVDFDILKTLATQPGVLHVFEPNTSVTAEELKKGLAFIRSIWG